MQNIIVQQDLKEIVSEKLSWKKIFNSTVLVTGASGILPSYMVETLLHLNETQNANIKIIGLIRNEEKARRRFSFYEGRNDLILLRHDVCKPFTCAEKIHYIIHAAGQASPKFYGRDPVGTLEGHAIGTANILKLAAEKSVQDFLYFSTLPVDLFDLNAVITENSVGKIDSMNLRECYTLGKLTGENLCVAYNHQYAVPFKIMRIAHTYGPMMPLDDGRVFADFVANILRGENISLNSDGSAERALLYISDAVKAYFRILLEGENAAVYNVASEEYTTILNLAKTLVSLYPKKNLRVTFNKPMDAGYLPAEKGHTVRISVEKLKKLGWRQKYSIREGFARTIESFL